MQLDAKTIVGASTKAATALGARKDCAPYSPETIGDMLTATVHALVGAGTIDNAAERLAADPGVAHLPDDVIAALVGPCMEELTAALLDQVGDDLEWENRCPRCGARFAGETRDAATDALEMHLNGCDG